jgi:hypothetical protein
MIAGGQGAARKLLNLALVVIVLILAAGSAYEVKRTTPAYQETALVVFSVPKSQSAPYAYTMFVRSLITSANAITEVLMSPQAQRQIREAGGAAEVSMALVNLYSEQYPDYGQPIANLTAMSPSAANARRSFAIAARLITRLLAARQAHASVRPRNRISVEIIGDTGLVAQKGSLKRVYAGLAILTLVAVSVARGVLRPRGINKNLPAAAAYHSGRQVGREEGRPITARS